LYLIQPVVDGNTMKQRTPTRTLQKVGNGRALTAFSVLSVTLQLKFLLRLLFSRLCLLLERYISWLGESFHLQILPFVSC